MAVDMRVLALYIIIGFVSMTVAQTDKQQINITMCNWRRFRANVIRDTVYLDGGDLTWMRGYSDDTTYPDSDPTVDNTVFTLSFNSSFNSETANHTSLFGRISRPGGNAAPLYVDGTMFATNEVLYTYGGLLSDRGIDEVPPKNTIWGYEAYQYGAAKPYWEPTGVMETTGDEITRYITNGAGVSAPSEKLGFYFSGMHGANYSEIRMGKQYQANETSDHLITVDMTQWREPKFRNDSLNGTSGRANAELVWLPVFTSGALIAIGGVTNPEVVFTGNSSSNEELWEENRKEDPGFMKSVDVYDVAGGIWYTQKTSGETPPPLAEFCSVVAIAEDKTSYNIYIYGGYNGIDRGKRPYDAVYVLSIPSFKWIRVYKGEGEHGRHGHKCVKPYPDQMMVLGGHYIDPTNCLDGGIIQVFSLNNLEFRNTYDPEEWEEYRVPDVITKEIGGGKEGGATSTTPEDEWADEFLEDLFSSEYKKSIETWYPYEPVESPTSTPDPDDDDDEPSGDGGFPKWAGAVLGVVLGLAVITGLAVIWLILRRRRERSRYPHSVGVTSENNNNRILGWMYNMGMSTHKADMTTTSTEIGINDKHASAGIYSESGIDSVSSPHAPSTTIYSDMNAPEAGGRPIHEMQAGTVTIPSELPTSYNELPATTRHLSDTPSFQSPISPAVSPTPDNQDRGDEIQSATPSHNRHHSSISSAGFPLSLDHAVAADNAESRISHHRVSGFKEDFSTEGPPDPDDAGPSSKDPSGE